MYQSNKYDLFLPIFIIDQLRNSLQLKYNPEFQPTFWANHCLFYNYWSLAFSQVEKNRLDTDYL